MDFLLFSLTQNPQKKKKSGALTIFFFFRGEGDNFELKKIFVSLHPQGKFELTPLHMPDKILEHELGEFV